MLRFSGSQLCTTAVSTGLASSHWASSPHVGAGKGLYVNEVLVVSCTACVRGARLDLWQQAHVLLTALLLRSWLLGLSITQPHKTATPTSKSCCLTMMTCCTKRSCCATPTAFECGGDIWKRGRMLRRNAGFCCMSEQFQLCPEATR